MKTLKAVWWLFLWAWYYSFGDDFEDVGPKCELEYDGDKLVPKRDVDGNIIYYNKFERYL